MKMNKPHLLFWEMVVLLASVPVFRSVWLFLDRVEWMSRPGGLWMSLAVGLIVGVVALAAVNRAASE